MITDLYIFHFFPFNTNLKCSDKICKDLKLIKNSVDVVKVELGQW